tara:strand:+ start:145 stop:495 length:351 start_codon:yes stop_codon:yes gene_type:complete
VRAGRHSGQNFKVFCAAFNRLQVRRSVSKSASSQSKWIEKGHAQRLARSRHALLYLRSQDQCRVSAFVDTVGKAQAAFNTAAAPAAGSQHARSRMATPLSGAGMRWDARGPRSFAA